MLLNEFNFHLLRIQQPDQTTWWLVQTDRQGLRPNLACSDEPHSINWSRHKSKFGIMY